MKKLLFIIKNILSRNRLIALFLQKKHNNIHFSRKCHITFHVYGKNNTIIISDTTLIKKGTITIFGNNCLIQVGDNCTFDNISLWIENDASKIIIGNHCKFYGSSEIASIEGFAVTIGNEVLAANGLSIVNGDSHSIVNTSGNRTNYSKNITIGNHVWIGKNVTILKSGSLGNDIIVGADSLVTKDFSKNSNVIVGGSIAKIIKHNVNWCMERIK